MNTNSAAFGAHYVDRTRALGYRSQTYPLYHGNRQISQLPDTQILANRWGLLGPSCGGIPSAQSSQIPGTACEDTSPVCQLTAVSPRGVGADPFRARCWSNRSRLDEL